MIANTTTTTNNKNNELLTEIFLKTGSSVELVHLPCAHVGYLPVLCLCLPTVQIH